MTTFEAAFDGQHLRLLLNGHRLRVLWGLSVLGWAAVVADVVTSRRRDRLGRAG